MNIPFLLVVVLVLSVILLLGACSAQDPARPQAALYAAGVVQPWCLIGCEADLDVSAAQHGTADTGSQDDIAGGWR